MRWTAAKPATSQVRDNCAPARSAATTGGRSAPTVPRSNSFPASGSCQHDLSTAIPCPPLVFERAACNTHDSERFPASTCGCSADASGRPSPLRDPQSSRAQLGGGGGPCTCVSSPHVSSEFSPFRCDRRCDIRRASHGCPDRVRRPAFIRRCQRPPQRRGRHLPAQCLGGRLYQHQHRDRAVERHHLEVTGPLGRGPVSEFVLSPAAIRRQ